MNIPLILILSLASFFRLFDLSHLPISLFGDEVDVGYHAWSLITTGRDYMGNFLPSYIQSLSESRAPLLMYVTAPFVGLFGPSTFSVRLSVALLGVFGVYLIYLLSKKLFPDHNRLPLIAALVLSITPWHIHYSRAAFESTLLLDLLMLGTYLFLSEKIGLSLIAFALTFYTYSTANIFTPLLMTFLYVIFRPKTNLKKNLLRLVPAALLMIPITYQIFFGQAAGRFKGISVFSNQKTIDSVIISRTDPWVSNQKLDRVFTNKYEALFRSFLQNYSGSFNKDFLFVTGDPYFRHSVGQVGELLWPFVFFFLIGLAHVIKCFDKTGKLLLLWLLIAPIPSALTQGGGTHATRLFVMIPPLCILSALGLSDFFKYIVHWKYKNVALGLTAVAIIFSFGYYWNRYSSHYRYESAKYWHFGYSDIFTKLSSYLPIKGKLYINNTYEPSLIRFSFYTKLQPREFQRNFSTDDPDSYQTELFSGFRFGENIFFGQVKDSVSLTQLLSPGDLYVAVQGKEVPGDWDWAVTPPAGLTILEKTVDVFGKPLFYLVTKN